MKALFLRDIKLTLASRAPLLQGLLFFISVILITPFAIGQDPNTLAQIGPGMLWIGALFASLLNLNKLFQRDRNDGDLDLFVLSAQRQSLALIVFTKCLAHWAGTIVPLILVAPVLGFILHLDTRTTLATMLTLLCGTPAIIFIGAVGAALTISLLHNTLLIFIIILPWTIPIVIFGVAGTKNPESLGMPFLSTLALLTAFSLFWSVFSSFITAATLKYFSE